MLMPFEMRQLSLHYFQVNNELLICQFAPERMVAIFCFVVQSCCQCVRSVYLCKFLDQGLCLGRVQGDRKKDSNNQYIVSFR